MLYDISPNEALRAVTAAGDDARTVHGTIGHIPVRAGIADAHLMIRHWPDALEYRPGAGVVLLHPDGRVAYTFDAADPRQTSVPAPERSGPRLVRVAAS